MFSNFDIDDFLKNYWQKRPLFIKRAIPNFKSPLDRDELASLAMEEQAQSRLIVSNHEIKVAQDYIIEEGPFDSSRFQELGDKNWNLLIQEVDHWSDEILQLRKYLSFIPHWRFDDVMASLGGRGGHVGAHLDWYDVFILQAQGNKTWSLEKEPRSFSRFEGEHLIKDLDVKLLSDFGPELTFEMEPGDLLYIPIGYAHQGVNQNETLSFSFGLRAPTMRDMILEHLKDELSCVHEDERLLDDPTCWERPGQIPSELILSLLKNWPSSLTLPKRPQLWFGKLVTTPMRHEVGNAEDLPWDELLKELEQGTLFRNPHARLAYFIDENSSYLFANGERLGLNKSATSNMLLETICDQLDFSNLELLSFQEMEGFKLVLRFLYDQQVLILDSE